MSYSQGEGHSTSRQCMTIWSAAKEEQLPLIAAKNMLRPAGPQHVLSCYQWQLCNPSRRLGGELVWDPSSFHQPNHHGEKSGVLLPWRLGCTAVLAWSFGIANRLGLANPPLLDWMSLTKQLHHCWCRSASVMSWTILGTKPTKASWRTPIGFQ